MKNVNPIYLEKTENIATIIFNRPEKRNALSLDMWRRIPMLLKEVEEDKRMRVLVLRGVDHQAFSAGADISEFQTHRSSPEQAKMYREFTLTAERMLAEIPIPTISMIQGYCVGGGCELAVACDSRFSDTTGKFGITPAKLGFVYHFSGTKHLIDLVGPSHAKDILYSGRIFESEEALHMGLVDRMFLPEEIVEKTYEYASLLARNSQSTISGAKKIMHSILHGQHMEDEEIANLILASFQGKDYQEGVQAFREKRKPNFLSHS